MVGLSESEKEAILERHMADLAMQQEAREEERRRQREMLEVNTSVIYLCFHLIQPEKQTQLSRRAWEDARGGVSPKTCTLYLTLKPARYITAKSGHVTRKQ